MAFFITLYTLAPLEEYLLSPLAFSIFYGNSSDRTVQKGNMMHVFIVEILDDTSRESRWKKYSHPYIPRCGETVQVGDKYHTVNELTHHLEGSDRCSYITILIDKDEELDQLTDELGWYDKFEDAYRGDVVEV